MSVTSYLVSASFKHTTAAVICYIRFNFVICSFLCLFCFIRPSQDLGEGELSEGGVELPWPARSAGLTAQLQALKKALYHKYVQEVGALKEQHSRELRRLREERQKEWERGERQEESEEKEQDLNGINGAGISSESLGAAGQVPLEERQDWERVEEEVAKVGDYNW